MIHGEINTFLRALGAREGDPALAECMALIASAFEIDEYDDAPRYSRGT